MPRPPSRALRIVLRVCSFLVAFGSLLQTSVKLRPSAVLYRDVPASDMRRRV